MKKKSSFRGVVFYCVVLVLVLVMLFSGLQILESTVFYKDQGASSTIPSKTIVRNGISYYPRQDITVVMVLGIDQFGVMEDSGSYNNDGAADMVSLLIFDETNKECRVLCLNRDTMMDIPVLGLGGKPAGKIHAQLALAHTYGSGMEDSCENTRAAVSNFLYGLQIDYYAAINMEAIVMLNDAVGGVTVNITDDFSDIDPTLTMGQVTLMGQQAIHFVRTRKGVSDQLNLSRMQRQKQYMSGFVSALTAKKNDTEFVMSIYEQVAPYMVTDCSATVITNLMGRYGDYPIVEVVSPEGKNVLGEYYEFHVDPDALDALILRLFYAVK